MEVLDAKSGLDPVDIGSHRRSERGVSILISGSIPDMLGKAGV